MSTATYRNHVLRVAPASLAGFLAGYLDGVLVFHTYGVSAADVRQQMVSLRELVDGSSPFPG